jgi:thymidine phosphorylase
MQDPRRVLALKRDGRRLEPEDLAGFVSRFAEGQIPDYQAAAFLMAAFIRGLDPGHGGVG